MNYYREIYKKRLNRLGSNSTSRLEKGRRINFERFLKASPHYLTFKHNDKTIECVFEPYRQNQSRNIMQVLCRVGENFEAGDVATIDGKHYMFWYWNERQDSGYNKWTVLELSQPITWHNDEHEYHGEAYIFSQENNMLKNEIKSRSRSATLYLENLKLEFMIMPVDKFLKINSYLELEVAGIMHYWNVEGIDSVSTPGVMYVSMNPVMKKDLTPMPEKKVGDDKDDFFWGGEVE